MPLILIALLVSLLAAPAAAQIQPSEYAARRDTVAGYSGGGVMLVVAAPEPEEDYLSFYQDPYYLYLTGIREAAGALLLTNRGGATRAELFVQPRNPALEVWSGFRLGPERAASRSGIPSRLIGELAAALDSILRPTDTLWVAGGKVDDALLAGIMERKPGLTLQSGDRAILRARAFKSEAEIDLLRQAINITVSAHQEVMRLVEPGMNEFEAQALIEYTFRRNGADRPGFASIVGSGPNSTTLHYNANDRVMNAGDMLVMDIGASYGGYSADVTRSIPVSGKFSPEQRAVYTIVRDAQRAAEDAAKVGTSWRTVSQVARDVLARGLADLGLIEGADATYDCGRARQCAQSDLYYMHGLGHGIGLVVHDPDRHEVTGALGVGSVFTIEPGIYVRANLLDEVIPDTPANSALRERLRTVLPRYANIGVRIEDDYLVTDSGLEWLSRGAPREIAEVEEMMARPYTGPAPRDSAMVQRYNPGN